MNITTECIDGNEKKSDDAEPDFYSIPDDEPAQNIDPNDEIQNIDPDNEIQNKERNTASWVASNFNEILRNIKKVGGVKIMMNCAFLVANINILLNAYLSTESDRRTASLALVSFSILFQIIVGLLLIYGSYIRGKPINPTNNEGGNLQRNLKTKLYWINVIDHVAIGFVFFTIILNTFISTLSL